MADHVKHIRMGTYDISVPKIFVWTLPVIFAAAFGISYAFIAQLTALPKCTSFKTAKDAQYLFDSNPAKYAYLDINHDKIACNGL